MTLRNRSVFTAATCLGALLSASVFADDNLIVNPGFETGDLSGWTRYNPSNSIDALYLDNQYPHSGTWELVDGTIGATSTLSQNISVDAGRQYRLSFWLFQGDGAPPPNSTFEVLFDGQTIFANTAPLSNNYTEYVYTVSSSSNTGTLAFTFRNDAYFWFLDDVSLFAIVPTSDTQVAVDNLSANMGGAFMQQTIATNFANMNTYDCTVFSKNGTCIAVGGQRADADKPDANMNSGVFVAAKRLTPNFRLGGFVNQTLPYDIQNSVRVSNEIPLVGAFAIWNQQSDMLGLQVKLANAYQRQNVKTTREVVGFSELGTGETNLSTQSYVGELSYALTKDKLLVRPYAALRYSNIRQGAFTEDPTIALPLSYAGIENDALTSLLGAKLAYPLTEKINLTGSAGLEHDLYNHVDQLTASGMSGLASAQMSGSDTRDTRAVGSVGANYAVAENMRLSGEVFYQQLPFQKTDATVFYMNYAVGF